MKFKKLFGYSSTCSKGPAPIEPELYLINYPEKIPKEGKVPDEKKIKALTNLPFLEEWVFKLMKDVDFPGWEVEKIGSMTYEEAKKEYKIEDGEPVEIPEGREWDSDGKGRWATSGVLARLRGSRFFGICYGTFSYGAMRNISVTKAWGYTNEFHMLDTFDKILSSQTHYFVIHKQYIAQNEKDIKEAKEKDRGAVPIDGDLAHRNTTDDR